MAKGNDGNYFQHSIEVALGVHLATADPSGRLHVAFAHAMAPFEVCEDSKPGQSQRLLTAALNLSQAAARVDEPPVVAAYRATGATRAHYPNSAELLRAVIGVNRLTGGLTEVDATNYEPLAKAWAGSGLRAANASWRGQLDRRGVLACPSQLEAPWLFTLDPMTYKDDGDEDDNNVHRSDIERLGRSIGSFVSSEQPGVAAIFVYAVRPRKREAFWRFADDLAARCGGTLTTFWHVHQGGNRNLAALLSGNSELPSSFPPAGVSLGRE